MNPIEVRLERAGVTESVHEVHAVVLGSDGRRIGAFGDPAIVSFWRSAMKPFQAIPMLESGLFEALDLGDPEVAIACASHQGTAEHVAVAERILSAAGLEEEALACGPHRPVESAAATALDSEGRLPGRIHNNCSGKHAGMLALALSQDWPGAGYHTFGHPVQRAIRAGLESWLSVDLETLSWGTDGCGVPTPALPIEEMARAYVRLSGSESAPARRVVRAMTTHPILVSGRDALSTTLMVVGGGRLLAKEGAEGVFCVAETSGEWGAAFKVADGAMRALGPSVVHALASWNLLGDDERERLAAFEVVGVDNTRSEPVGVLRTAEVAAGRAVGGRG